MFALKFGPKLPQQEIDQALAGLRTRILPTSPVAVYLVGSTADGTAKVGSDIDLVLVYRNQDVLRTARKKIHHGWKESISRLPVDFIFFVENEFDRKQDLGGVAFEARHFGKKLFPGIWGHELQGT
jgi:predicted nucleotidyltransferase